MINGMINPYPIMGDDPNEFLRKLLEGQLGAGTATGDSGVETLQTPSIPQLQPLNTQMPAIKPMADVEDERTGAANPNGQAPSPLGTYMGEQVVDERNPGFLDRLEGLGAARREMTDGQISRAYDDEAYARDQQSRAGLLTTAGGILSRSLPDANPYINARNLRSEQTRLAETTRQTGAESDNDKLNKYIDDAYTDTKNNENTKFERGRTRYQAMTDVMSPDGKPVFLDKDAPGGPRYVTSDGQIIDDMTSLRPIREDNVIQETSDGYYLINKRTGEAKPITGGSSSGSSSTSSSASTGGANNTAAFLQQVIPGVRITGGDRSVERNREVGGAKNSWHLQEGKAVDFAPPPGMTIQQARKLYEDAGWTVHEAIDETKKTNGTGPHFHIAASPPRGGATPVSNSGNGGILRPVSSAAQTNFQRYEAADGTQMIFDPRTGQSRPSEGGRAGAVSGASGTNGVNQYGGTVKSEREQVDEVLRGGDVASQYLADLRALKAEGERINGNGNQFNPFNNTTGRPLFPGAGDLKERFGIGDTANRQLAQQYVSRLELRAAEAMKGQGTITESERAILRNGLPNLNMAPPAFNASVDGAIKEAERQIARRDAWIAARRSNPNISFNEWAQTNARASGKPWETYR